MREPDEHEPEGEGALYGDWELVRWTLTVGEEAPRFPFGEDCCGRISYLPSGRMWATLMRRDRPRVQAEGIYAATEEEQAQMAAGYVAYGGRFRLERGQPWAEPGGEPGAEVVHTVEHSLFPNWVGTELRRRARFVVAEGESEPHLVLEPAPRQTRGGRPIHTRLVWRRLGAVDQGAEGEPA